MNEIEKKYNEKKQQLLQSLQQKEALEQSMADPRRLSDQQNEINDKKKELDILENVKDISLENKNKGFIDNLDDLKKHYQEEKQYIDSTTQMSESKKNEMSLNLDEKIKTINKLDKEDLDSNELQLNQLPEWSFFDD